MILYFLLASLVVTAIAYPMIMYFNKDNWQGLVHGVDKASVIEFNTRRALEKGLPKVFLISLCVLAGVRLVTKVVSWAFRHSDFSVVNKK